MMSLRSVVHTTPYPVTTEYEDGSVLQEVYEITFEVERFRIVDVLRGLFWGISYRYPPCCVLAFVWWSFWHGAPATRQWQRGAQLFDHGRAYVPCHWHGGV